MDEEDREFVGYFMGEGCLTINAAHMKTTKGIRTNCVPIITISSRADDGKVLEWIKQRYGGYIYKYNERIINGYKNQPYKIRPVWMWKVGTRIHCLRIIDLLLQAKIPSKKRQEVELFKRFLELKKRGIRHEFQGKWYTDEEIEEQLRIQKELSSMKKYKTPIEVK